MSRWHSGKDDGLPNCGSGLSWVRTPDMALPNTHICIFYVAVQRKANICCHPLKKLNSYACCIYGRYIKLQLQDYPTVV